MLNKSLQTAIGIDKGRLKKRPEFLAVAATEQKWVSDSVIIQYKTSEHSFRYGVTATKRVGNAVTRNRCKRRLRAAIDTIKQQHPLNPADIVLVARHTTATCDWDKLVGDMQWCLKRLGVTQKKIA